VKTIVAKRLRKSAESGLVTNHGETVVCGKCGQRFAIPSDSSVPDTELIGKRIAWLKDQLVWDHIQERRHHGSMELPDLK